MSPRMSGSREPGKGGLPLEEAHHERRDVSLQEEAALHRQRAQAEHHRPRRGCRRHLVYLLLQRPARPHRRTGLHHQRLNPESVTHVPGLECYLSSRLLIMATVPTRFRATTSPSFPWPAPVVPLEPNQRAKTPTAPSHHRSSDRREGHAEEESPLSSHLVAQPPVSERPLASPLLLRYAE